MNRQNYLIISLLYCIFFSCEEIYNPTLDNVTKVLVVESLITDEAKPHIVYLSMAAPFNSSEKFPETGAKVFVTDNKGATFIFDETSPGTYQANHIFFKPEVGNKYVLTVETNNHKVYKSSEQELLSKGSSTDISNSRKVIERYKFISGEFKLTKLEGAEFIAPLNLQTESNPYFRYSNTILVEYTELSPPPNESWNYCWKKYNPNEYFNINNFKYNNSGLYQHDLGFFPLDTTFYGVVLETHIAFSKITYTHRYLYTFIVSIKQYHINEDIYEIYKNINKQLEAEQHIFDPISTQINGNIKCITDPKEKVFGLFEVSSVNESTYKLNYGQTSTVYDSKKINSVDLDIFSNKGKNRLTPPPFWIY